MMLFAPGAHPAELANFIGYCLAHNAERYGIQVHASLWMSDHHHTDVTDPDANLVPFKQQLHSVVARARNARLGRFDSVWSGDDPCDTGRVCDLRAQKRHCSRPAERLMRSRVFLRLSAAKMNSTPSVISGMPTARPTGPRVSWRAS
ncbi:hypothetical protein ENSA5_61250 [Enhygromyxa salina]|uniref:Transposase n=1 Tax=Enhygromyxa salina TaxID=215803 RepID=A0A2S9XD71_9BACT|nr:hypothetical protein ENSA5_61250 [Enhygromyxa salina]